MKEEDSIITDSIDQALQTLHFDPIAGKLIEKSFLTEIQMETLLIHLIADAVTNKRVKYEKKASFRKIRPISKGAFNRTLKQAQRNVISSIYTILLLGYLGILDSPALRPYLEVSNRLEEYGAFLNQHHPVLDYNTRKLLNDTLKLLEKEISELGKPRNILNRP